MIPNPLCIHAYARTRTIESIMCLVGRSLPEPRRVRRFLEELPTDSLDRLFTELLDGGEFPKIVIQASAPPAPSSALASGDHAAADVSKLNGAPSLCAPSLSEDGGCVAETSRSSHETAMPCEPVAAGRGDTAAVLPITRS